jgi:hypothetical protein
VDETETPTTPLEHFFIASELTRLGQDRLSYHVSANVEKIPSPDTLANQDLPLLLDDFQAREVLHVTFGSLLAKFGVELRVALMKHESAYQNGLREHFRKNLIC